MIATVFNESGFEFSNAAWVTVAMNGSLSAACSILIMSIILRSSPEARSSAYHIIMFFMSFWDSIASIAMSFNTIPMPRDVYDIYPFAGMAFGNVRTCEVQGLFLLMGIFFVFGSNTTLNLYYVSTIRFGMTEEMFKKKIMPTMLVLSILISIMIPVTALRADMINPTPIGGVCSISPYPFGCVRNSDGDEHGAIKSSIIKCIRGDPATSQNLSRIWNCLLGVVFVVMVISLVLVVLSVFDAELKIRRNRRIHDKSTSRLIQSPTRDNQHKQQIHDFERTRTVMTQASMYIGAFLLSYVWIFVLVAKLSTHTPPSNTLAFFATFFQPLQGFFNAIIFIYLKAHTIRHTNTDLSLYSACKQVILAPSTVPQQVVSNIEIATEDIKERRRGDTRRRRGKASLSRKQRVKKKSSRLRRSGSNMESKDNNDATVSLNSIDFDSDSDDGSSSSLCLSDEFSLRDLLGPDYDDEFSDPMEDREEGSVTSYSSNEQDYVPSYMSMNSTSFSLSVNLMCSIIPEEADEDDSSNGSIISNTRIA